VDAAHYIDVDVVEKVSGGNILCKDSEKL